MRCLPFFGSLLLAGSLSVALAQQSQGGQGPHHQMMSVEDRVNQLKTQLGLSADQVTKITAIMQTQRDTMQALREKYGDDRQSMRQAMSGLRANADKAISAVLTDTQRKKYEAMIAQRQKERGDRGQGNAQGKPAGQNDKSQ
jgi:Spy/CpxP family protein refolding chaperone